ncbi:MAG: EH signature domain-containing protein [Candidatus Accumulibacter phosphatis]|jgi:hypothetical protein|uniref:EH signature domain-containing protein n=1 Tax=Candidatus Accumulibacter sp. ACC012 TaxID=2823332 RepID=UPI0025BEE64E|nr:EH signature domain-containing protein [Candidatus Accumulibacter sp. ACC012]
MSPHLDQLRQQVQSSFGDSLRSPEWGAPVLMTQALQAVKAQFDSSSVSTDPRSIAKTLLAFRNTRSLTNFIDLKYACFGVSQRVGRDGWSLIEDEALFELLLGSIKDLNEFPRRLRKCYQGLMHSYFNYAILDEEAAAGVGNWLLLRKFLVDHLSVALSVEPQASWLRTLGEHRNLLADNPCDRYAPQLMNGDASELVAASESIGLATSSWVWQEAITSHTQQVCKLKSDKKFREYLDVLLDLLDGKGGVQLSRSIAVDCIALILIRYVKGKDLPEHPHLRDLAVEQIGNPWLKRTAWDAHVKNDEARKMVDGWLKRRLITDFFALLSEDGAADQRRLNYWLRFEPVIEDMWFALGPHAGSTNTSNFRDMRKRMEGRLHYLDGQGSPYNNAFIMKIGSFMVVEFGITGNATFIYNAQDLNLDSMRRHVAIHTLKARNRVARLIHMANWEGNFDAWLLPRIGWSPQIGAAGSSRSVDAYLRPAAEATVPEPRHAPATPRPPPTMVAVNEVIYAHNLKFDDRRSKNGAFWILHDDSNPTVNAKLQRLGFRYKAPRGWWKE